MKKAAGVWVVVMAFVAARLGAAVNVKDWEFSQAMDVTRPGVVKVEVPLATLDHSAEGGRDVRLLGPDGGEVAFAWVESKAVQPEVLAAERFQVLFEGDDWVALIKTGTERPLANVRVEVATKRFIKAARVEVSDDGERWERLADGVPFLRMDGEEQVALPLGGRVAKWIRLTMAGQDKLPIVALGARVEEASGRDGETVEWPVTILRREEFAGETVLALDFGAAQVELNELVVRADEPVYARAVWLGRNELRDEKSVEQVWARGQISRLEVVGAARIGLDAVWVGGRLPTRVLNLHVVNRDSAPLRALSVSARRTPRQAVFLASAAGEYRWLSGNAQVRAAQYDLGGLAGLLKQATESGGGVGRVGELVRNAGFVAPDAMSGLTLEGGVFEAKGWTKRRTVSVREPGVQMLELDAEVVAGAREDLGDLRLVRGGRQVPYLMERTNLSRMLEVKFAEERVEKRPALSRWKLTLPHEGLAVSQLRLEASSRLFERSFSLYEERTTRNGETSRLYLGESVWRRDPANAESVGHVTPERRPGRVIWLETENGDNPVIGLTRVQAVYPVTRLLFQAMAASGPESGEAIELWYANEQASAPRYDVGLVVGRLLAAERRVATLSEGTEVAGEQAGKTGWKPGGWVLWAGLSVVVLALLGIVAKLLPKEKN